jgi:thioredoxin-like negative regulator of GroEL
MTAVATETVERLGRPPVARKPKLLLFYSPQSGRCRRVEGFLAQVLQHRRNHDTFDLIRVSVLRRRDLAERFRVADVPTILVVDERKVRRRIVDPKGCSDLRHQLAPWLR